MTHSIQIGNHLVEAYTGYYEDERAVEQDDGSFKVVADMTKEEFDTWVRWRIIKDSPQERLERYCEWNGILGYHRTLFDIATGKL